MAKPIYEILYNDEIIATITPGNKAAIHCAGDIMEYNLVVRPAPAPEPSGYNVVITQDNYYSSEASITYTDDTGSHTITTTQGVQLENVTYIKINSMSAIDYWDSPYTICEQYTAEQLLAGVSLTKDANIIIHVSCLIEGTPITLADGQYKMIQDITYEDDLLVWDFDNGCFASAKPLWIQQERKAIEYNHLVFSDGSELNTVNQHRVFNVEKGMFTYPMTDDTPVGTTTFNDKGEFIILVSKEVIEKEVNYYNIITDYHINLFAGTILTSCRLSNIYPIENMKYVKDDREIISISEFNVPEEYYYGLRLGEQPTDINRDGSVSFGDTSVEDYVKRLLANRKDVNP